MPKIPILFSHFPALKNGLKVKSGKILIFFLTFVIYAAYHATRKPISVIKPKLHENCTEYAIKNHIPIPLNNSESFCWFAPFDKPNYSTLLGLLDTTFLIAYAVAIFFSGHLADHSDLRYFLSFGCLLTGLSTCAFGIGYFAGIHSYAYYVIVQIVSGIFQATGWPAVIAVMGSWYGRGNRGLFLGIWNSHTSLGNIFGTLMASAFVDTNWGWSFALPGLVMIFVAILTFLFMVPRPEDIGLPSPHLRVMKDQSGEDDSNASRYRHINVSDDDDDDEEDSSKTALLRSSTNYASMELDNGEIEVNPSSSYEEITVTQHEPIGFLGAVRLPGVVEYSICLFFSKLVAYTFLFWLPTYISDRGNLESSEAAELSTVFDLGGILGGILAGLVSDRTRASAITCTSMLLIGVPLLYVYYLYGAVSIFSSITWLAILGVFVNGPYALITTSVAADIGTHESLQGNPKALATVTAIIDGTGSLGAILGPFLVGLMRNPDTDNWLYIFMLLMGSLLIAALLLMRRVIKEVKQLMQQSRERYANQSHRINYEHGIDNADHTS